MRVRDSLGQVRVAGRDVDFYTDASQRPFPYKSEDELINEGIEKNLRPPWGRYDWPGYVRPPNVPSLEEEIYDIRRGGARKLWAHAGTWNLNRLSTKELRKTKYPPSPVMSGLGKIRLNRRNPMLASDYELGQTTVSRRGAGNMFGPGHFSVTSFPIATGGEEMFGGLGEEALFGTDEGMFGLGQEEAGPEIPALSKPLLERKTAVSIRDVANFVAAAGGSILAITSMGKGRSQTTNVALGALGAGLGVMALLSLGKTFKLVQFEGIY